MPASLADRDPNAQHQGGALEARTSKEAGGFGVVRWSPTPCERPDSILGAQRGPSRQQVELDFWRLKLQFSCSSELVSFVFAFRCPVRSRFPGEKETEEPIFWVYYPKSNVVRLLRSCAEPPSAATLVMIYMPYGAFLRQPLKQNEIHLHNGRVGPGPVRNFASDEEVSFSVVRWS